MSKVDAQRAMREAKYAARRATSGTVARAIAPPASVEKDEPQPEPVAKPQPSLCGHRSIGNKSCTRPAGHAEKNHRYK